MTLGDAVRTFEAGMASVCEEIGRSRLAPNGEPYVSLCNGGIKPEGEPMPCWADTPDDAITGWLDAATTYATERGRRGGVLYWREKPELEAGRIRGQKRVRYAVYSRLLVSTHNMMESVGA